MILPLATSASWHRSHRYGLKKPMPALVKDQLPAQRCLNHLDHQLALSFGNSYGALGESSGHCLRCEVRTPLTFLGFKISKSSDSFAGHIDPDVLRRSVGITDKGSYSTGVEYAIKITAGSLGSIGVLVTGSLDLCAGVVGLLQTFCSFVGLFEQHGVALCSGGALGDKVKQDLAGIDSCVSETPTEQLRPNGGLGFDLPSRPSVPATNRSTRNRLRLALLPCLLRDSGALNRYGLRHVVDR
jgi:hypothetical protein